MSMLLVEHFAMSKGVWGNMAAILEFWFLQVLGTCETEFGSVGSVFLSLFFQTRNLGELAPFCVSCDTKKRNPTNGFPRFMQNRPWNQAGTGVPAVTLVAIWENQDLPMRTWYQVARSSYRQLMFGGARSRRYSNSENEAIFA
jgi:hypothetical protein